MDERSFIAEIKEYERAVEDIKINKNELIATKNSIERQLKGEEPFMVTMYSRRGIGDTIKAHEGRLRLLMSKYTENYPEVIRLKGEIETLKKDQTDKSLVDQNESEISASNPVYQELKQKLMELESNIKAANAREKHLNLLIKKKEEGLNNVPENKKRLTDMVNERNSYTDIYAKLLERLGQSEVSKQMEIEDKSTTFRIVEPAVLPTIPVSPPRKAIIFFGIVFGILGSIGVIVLMDRMDSSIKSVSTLKTLGLPVLAIIPRMSVSESMAKISRKDILLYSFAGVYMICILGVLAMELLGITYVDKFITEVFLNNMYG